MLITEETQVINKLSISRIFSEYLDTDIVRDCIATICATARPGEPSMKLSWQDIMEWPQTVVAGLS